MKKLKGKGQEKARRKEGGGKREKDGRGGKEGKGSGIKLYKKCTKLLTLITISLTLSLLFQYLLFVMALVTVSIMLTILVINIHFRSPSTHEMSPWLNGLFLKVLPRLLFMQRPHGSRPFGSIYTKVSAF